MELSPKPRFHALTWGQLIGVLIIVGGMFCHWIGVDSATVPRSITWRIVSVIVIIFLSFVIPQVWNLQLLKQIAVEDGAPNVERLADSHVIVRRMLWGYSYGNLFLGTYLVHITGGMTGSMFTGLFVLLPSVPLLLRSGPADIRQMGWFIFSCAIAILASFFMSRYHFVAFNASSSERAFHFAMLAVTLGAIMVPLFESVILRYQMETDGK